MRSLNEAFIDRLSFDFAGISSRKTLPELAGHEDADTEDLNWITINGTHIPLNEEGKAVGGPLAGSDFSNAKTETSSNHKESAFTPKRSDYVTEYEDEYSGKIRLEDAPPEDQFTYWKEMNMDKLKEVYREAVKEAKENGTTRPSANDLVRREWYGFQTSKVNDDVREMTEDEAGEVLAGSISQNVIHGWFREANSQYKPRLVDAVISSQEARNAALSIMYENYKQIVGDDVPFEEFLTTPIKMYRGGHGQQHMEGDVFSAYSFSKKIAEGFAGNDGRVYEAEIRPIDTWGSVFTNLESEIMVPSWIAPNGNVDSVDKDEADEDEGAESDLYHHVEDVNSEEWLDDEILRRVRSVGVYVLNMEQGKILTGTRKDLEHFGQLCGPGGHVEPGESLTDAAIRETQEEFGITPTDLKFIGFGDYEEDSGLIPAIFVCTEYEGDMITADFEMDNQRFRTLPDIYSHNLFAPFKKSLQIVLETLTIGFNYGIINMGEENTDSEQFNEIDHPRDEEGKFTSSGSSTSANNKQPVSQKPTGSRHESTSADLKNAIKSGVIGTKLDRKAQSKHHQGSPKYNAATQRGDFVSYFSISDEELDKIVQSKRGTGKVYNINGQYKEVIDAGQTVGTYLDRRGKKSQTSFITVHYSKTGYHAVPASSHKGS